MKDNPYILSPAERNAITWIRTVARALVPTAADACEMVAASLEAGCHTGLLGITHTVPAPDSLLGLVLPARLADLPGPSRALPESRPAARVLPEQTWYAFECGSSVHNVMLDVRLDGGSTVPPVVACPLCAAPMCHRGTWPATENGFGGLPDDGNNVLHYARRAADLHGDEYPACWDLGQAIDALDAATRAKTPLETP